MSEEALGNTGSGTPEGAGALALPHAFGRYMLLEEIGCGAMGVVYAATDTSLGRNVAIKVLRGGPGQEEGDQRRFAAEARAIARVRHPSIVEIFDHGTIGGRLFYAMSLVDGMTLREAVELHGALSAATVAQGGAQVAAALGALHAAGIVHRDVKPQNIMIDPDGSWILADFGLARDAEAPTLTGGGQVLGTPLYMSPEQVAGRRADVDQRTDVYGLGAALYEAVSGRAPFVSDALPALLGRVATERPPPPSTHLSGLSRDVDRVLLKCLEKRQEDRYATAEALRDDLLALEAGTGVRGRPVSWPRRAVRRARRRWGVTMLVALGVAVPLFALIAWVYVPGTLYVRTLADATFAVGESQSAPLPRHLDLPAGSRVLKIEAPGFRTRVLPLQVTPWGQYRYEPLVLAPVDVQDPRAQDQLARLLGIVLGEVTHAEQAVDDSRGPVRTRFLAVVPRGDVTQADLGRLVLEWDVESIDGGRLVFRRGAELLHEDAFDPDRVQGAQKMPEAVLAALKPGDTLTWGLVDTHGVSSLATARVIPSLGAPSPLLGLVEHASDLGSVTTAVLAVRALLGTGRVSAALVYLDDNPVGEDDEHLLAGLRRAVLRRLFRDDTPALMDSELWQRAN